jgi:Ca2+-binding RTX toxin-like protein
VSGSAHDDLIYGHGGVNVLIGRGGNDTIYGSDGNDTLEGGEGNDLLYGEHHDDLLDGGAGNDTYFVETGSGNDTITDAGGSDRLNFADAIAPDELWFSQNGNDLVISRLGTVDGIIITDWFASTNWQIEEITAGDGAVILYASEVNSLISQIAAFSAQIGSDPSAVQPSNLPPEYQLAVNSVWQAA